MKLVYIVTRADSVSGASIHVRDLAAAMRGCGHDALVLVGGTGPVTEQFEKCGVPFRPLRHLRRAVDPIRDALAFHELSGVLRELKPDLVSTHTAKAGWVGRAVCARLGIACVYTPHGWTVTDRISPSRGFLFRLAEKAAAGWSRGIICVCENERKIALELGIGRPERLFVVHNGVRAVAEEFRARPEAEPVRLISVARFEAPKDHATLMAALGKLGGREWELDLVGEGPLEGEIRRAAAGHGIGGRVRFLGYQQDPAAALARAQIFVLSSRSEGFPRSVLEAMRAGLPVVASDAGGVSEAVEDGRTGILVPRDDPDRLAGALDKVITSSAMRQRLGEAAHLRYNDQFRVERMVQRTVAVYNGILGIR